ncbi:MarR family winged helix-turn-helix transcriptional regulator [Streptosporangium sp. NPDC000396]|uniref:MarR family winged helix-turn-helix transcriptional regulator n=1 Tax=Streptosporangium sp. NPDC000396 TaxID=3366185 RepID=UPI0036AD6268
MNDVNPASPVATVAFRLGTLGAVMTDRFAARIESYDLKPKHVGLMTVLDSGGGSSQLEIARIMGIAPSLVVSLADHLENLGAIQRIRDPEDRRRQVLTLTASGRDLLRDCAREAQEVDAEFTAGLSPADQATLSRLLGTVAAVAGLPA